MRGSNFTPSTEMIAVMGQLVCILQRSERVLAEAAGHAVDGDIALLLYRHAGMQGRLQRELQLVLWRFLPPDSTRCSLPQDISARLERTWADLRHAVSRGDRLSLITCIERADAITLERYSRLTDAFEPSNVHDMLAEHCQSLHERQLLLQHLQRKEHRRTHGAPRDSMRLADDEHVSEDTPVTHLARRHQ